MRLKRLLTASVRVIFDVLDLYLLQLCGLPIVARCGLFFALETLGGIRDLALVEGLSIDYWGHLDFHEGATAADW